MSAFSGPLIEFISQCYRLLPILTFRSHYHYFKSRRLKNISTLAIPILKDDFQSELRSLRTLMFIGRTRWNANRCYSLRTTYLIFETFQSPFPTDSLIFTAVKLFHEVI